ARQAYSVKPYVARKVIENQVVLKPIGIGWHWFEGVKESSMLPHVKGQWYGVESNVRAYIEHNRVSRNQPKKEPNSISVVTPGVVRTKLRQRAEVEDQLVPRHHCANDQCAV